MASRPHPSIPQLCGDWIYLTDSNAHVAKDREWFATYTPYETQIETPDGTVLDVAGVGKVHLSVRKTPSHSRHGRRAHAVLRLKNVLHVPAAPCNVVGRSLARFCRVDDDYGVAGGSANGCVRTRGGREMRGYFVPGLRGPDGELVRVLRMSGPPTGPYVTETLFAREDGPAKTKKKNMSKKGKGRVGGGDGGGGEDGDESGDESEGVMPDMGRVGAHWPSKEKRRWHVFVKEEKKKAKEADRGHDDEPAAAVSELTNSLAKLIVSDPKTVSELTNSLAKLLVSGPETTTDEVDTLQDAVEKLTLLGDAPVAAAPAAAAAAAAMNKEGKPRSLSSRAHLSGQTASASSVRAKRVSDETTKREGEEGEEEKEEEEENEDSAPMPMPYAGPDDHGIPQLNAEEKAWMKKHWGNEFQLLKCLGLNIHKDEQRAEGRQTVRAMMAMDEEDEEDGPDEDDSETDGVLLYRR